MSFCNSYHIDVTEEENLLFNDKLQQLASKKQNYFSKHLFKKMFIIVLGVHLVVAGSIVIGINSAKASDDKTTFDQTPVPKSLFAPEPTSIKTNPPSVLPAIIPPTTLPIKKTDKYTKTYIIKKGDTINNISKKYKLDSNKLLKINNIKDSNKIVVGQILKFM